MPWKEQSIVGERLRLIAVLLRGEKSVTYCCRIFGISRKTAYKWKARFLRDGRRAMKDKSRRPHRMPRRLGDRWIRRIRRVHKKHPTWGPKKVEAWFVRQGWRPACLRTIARWMKRMCLSSSRRRGPRKACVRLHPRLTVARRPNQVWTVDFKGWFYTGNGDRAEPLTVRDLFSRYGLLVGLLPDQRWSRVKGAMARLFRQCGLPEVIRVDNGGPFASTGPAGLSRLSVWWVRLGIRVEFTRPAHPQDNGSHEQFHRVMKGETIRPPAHTVRGQQHRTTVWLRGYNRLRPHEALGQKTPAQLYRNSQRRFPLTLPRLKYPLSYRVRHIRSNGEIRWRGRKRFIGEAFIRQSVGLKQLRRGTYAVYFASLLIGHLYDKDPGGMRPAVYQHRRTTIAKPKL
jgi:putative transposase